MQRMMMLLTRESEAQNADLPGGQVKVPVEGLLLLVRLISTLMREAT